MSGMGEKTRTVVTGLGEKVTGSDDKESNDGSMMDSVSEKVSGFGEKIKGSVKSVPESTSKSSDDLSRKIDVFLDNKSEQLIKDWELATQKDISNIEQKYATVSNNLGELEDKFDDFRGDTNKKLKDIEARLKKLENPE
jgi:hypothetical protein